MGVFQSSKFNFELFLDFHIFCYWISSLISLWQNNTFTISILKHLFSFVLGPRGGPLVTRPCALGRGWLSGGALHASTGGRVTGRVLRAFGSIPSSQPFVLLAPERSDGVSSGNWGFIYFFQLVSFCVLFLKSFRRIVTSLIVCNVPLGCC